MLTKVVEKNKQVKGKWKC